jgi:hypothetical protein
MTDIEIDVSRRWVVERQRVGDMSLYTHLFLLRMVNLRPDEVIRWKVEDRRLRKSGSVMWKVSTSKVVASSVSVKDWRVGPREQVLNILNACWRYGSGKSSSLSSTNAWFCPHCFNGCVGRETVVDMWIGQPMYCGSGQEPLFSRVVT